MSAPFANWSKLGSPRAKTGTFKRCWAQNPFGKEAFAASFKGLKGVRFEMSSDIKEIKVLADWAYLRNYLEVTMTPRDGGASVRRSGYTLTILRKESDGRWLLARDANLLAPQT